MFLCCQTRKFSHAKITAFTVFLTMKTADSIMSRESALTPEPKCSFRILHHSSRFMVVTAARKRPALASSESEKWQSNSDDTSSLCTHYYTTSVLLNSPFLLGWGENSSEKVQKGSEEYFYRLPKLLQDHLLGCLCPLVQVCLKDVQGYIIAKVLSLMNKFVSSCNVA